MYNVGLVQLQKVLKRFILQLPHRSVAVSHSFDDSVDVNFIEESILAFLKQIQSFLVVEE